MKDEPDLNRVPAQVRRLIENCLEKDLKKRLRDIGDAKIQVEYLLRETPEESLGAVSHSRPFWQGWLPWADRRTVY